MNLPLQYLMSNCIFVINSPNDLIFNFTEGGNGASSMVLQPDGKIVIGGGAITDVFTDFALLRFNMNGSLDTTFGDMGIMVTSIGPFNDFCHSLALQEDGKIVAIGHTYLNSIGSETICALARYLPDGSPDPDFGDDGIITFRGNSSGWKNCCSRLFRRYGKSCFCCFALFGKW